jgi:hypothetical protein
MFGHQLILKALLHVGGMWWLGGGGAPPTSLLNKCLQRI